jgi:uncharacterized membrane protein YfcA
MLIATGLGLVVGVILALTGAGGGILAVPLLVFGVGMSVAQAGPIGLLAVGMAAALGAVLGLKAGIVRYRAAMLISATGMLLSPVGLWLAHRTDNRWLSVLFALILLFVASKTYRKATGRLPVRDSVADPEQPCVRDGGTGRFVWTARCARSLALSGTVAGLLSGLLGVGGGFVMVPVLQRYTDLEMKATVATSLAVIALVSVTGVVSSAVSGAMNWAIGIPFAVGALVGMVAGRVVSERLAGPQLQIGFAAVSATVAIGMIAKVLY